MKRDMLEDEREIRNGIVDILCLLSKGDVTEVQLAMLKAKLEEAVKVIRPKRVEERV